jgi:hypothetical protein
VANENEIEIQFKTTADIAAAEAAAKAVENVAKAERDAAAAAKQASADGKALDANMAALAQQFRDSQKEFKTAKESLHQVKEGQESVRDISEGLAHAMEGNLTPAIINLTKGFKGLAALDMVGWLGVIGAAVTVGAALWNTYKLNVEATKKAEEDLAKEMAGATKTALDSRIRGLRELNAELDRTLQQEKAIRDAQSTAASAQTAAEIAKISTQEAHGEISGPDAARARAKIQAEDRDAAVARQMKQNEEERQIEERKIENTKAEIARMDKLSKSADPERRAQLETEKRKAEADLRGEDLNAEEPNLQRRADLVEKIANLEKEISKTGDAEAARQAGEQIERLEKELELQSEKNRLLQEQAKALEAQKTASSETLKSDIAQADKAEKDQADAEKRKADEAEKHYDEELERLDEQSKKEDEALEEKWRKEDERAAKEKAKADEEAEKANEKMLREEGIDPETGRRTRHGRTRSRPGAPNVSPGPTDLDEATKPRLRDEMRPRMNGGGTGSGSQAALESAANAQEKTAESAKQTATKMETAAGAIGGALDSITSRLAQLESQANFARTQSTS